MASLPRPACRPCGEEVLDPVEGGGVGEGLVEPGVLDALPGHDPGVGLVGQDVRQRGDPDGADGPVPASAVGEPPVGQLGDEAFEGPGRASPQAPDRSRRVGSHHRPRRNGGCHPRLVTKFAGHGSRHGLGEVTSTRRTWGGGPIFNI